MTGRISPDNELFLAEQVADGVFPNRDQAVDAAITLLREQTGILRKIDRGREQLDAGDCTEYDDESLADRFAALESRVQQRPAKSAGDA